MNFLLYMLGRARTGQAGIRPGARQMLIAGAASHAAAGDFHSALAGYRRLAGTKRGSALDVMIRGHLHLTVDQKKAAHHYFAVGIERFMNGQPQGEAIVPAAAGRCAVGSLLDTAEGLLRQGRFVRANETIRKARALGDVLLSARAGMVLAESRRPDSQPTDAKTHDWGSLVQLSDLTLRMLARTRLAWELGRSLQRRHLRENLAAWATSSPNVKELLTREFKRLALLAKALPGHAETQYRLGLVARAMGRLHEAAAAFDAVLRVHPHHVSSAARLAATRGELGLADPGRMQTAFDVKAPTLRLFASYAQAAGNPQAFDQTADRLVGSLCRNDKERTILRGNLAFALSEVAELDPVWSAWREPVVA